MRRAILLTGFNNWGKTEHIFRLFNRERYSKGVGYSIHGINTRFTVESHSNDDYQMFEFLEVLQKKTDFAPPGARDLFCAFCPSREPENDSLQILQTNPFTIFNEIHLLLLRYKWDFHAEMRISEIKNHLSSLKNVHYVVIDADAGHDRDSDRQVAKEKQIVDYLAKLYA